MNRITDGKLFLSKKSYGSMKPKFFDNLWLYPYPFAIFGTSGSGLHVSFFYDSIAGV